MKTASRLNNLPYGIIVVAGNFKKSQSQPPKDSEPPPRIKSNVKQNLQFLKLWKEFQQKNSSIPKPATSYRRKRVEKEDLPPDIELYKDPTLSLYYTNQVVDCAVPVLLVDGYNVCGYWAKLKKHFMSGQLDIARQKLIDELVQFSLVREVKVVTVFDAMMSGLPNHKETFAGQLWKQNTRKQQIVMSLVFMVMAAAGSSPAASSHDQLVDIIYSADSCADAWIEKEVVALKEDGCPKVWVVTSDHAQQHAAYGAGAFVWSSKALVSEIKASKKEMERMLQEQRSTSMQGKLLKHNLDTEVVDALKDLKMKLSQNDAR
ncbi:uncharacterized protein LOC104896988 isoform X1 [Beta vulgaris subsp. vulgaris]|uniref:uncharacterized protein LOC104896988 isoform X1 n=1 Tax=Beta vulgaris subsp. vulgaris TaxID=3555 RepID=UPI00053FF831|nr:uncharacterized protein LOC104896988 isoform X1 [Beta vulgaris subsp. vulgaris]